MIRLAESLAELECAAALDPVGGVAITSLYKCYSAYPFIDFYVWEQEGKIIGSFCRYDGTMTACCNAGDIEEAAAFLMTIGGFCAADLPVKLANRLKEEMGGNVFEAAVMQAKAPLTQAGQECTSASIIYDINQSAGAFEGGRVPWMADFSHRLRHGTAKAFVIKQNDEPVSCSAITHMDKSYGLIGCLAALPQYQGRGYGKLSAAVAIASAQSMGLIPLLCCKKELAGFYNELGCIQIGTRANYVLDLKG